MNYIWMVVQSILIVMGVIIGGYTIAFFSALALVKIPALKKVRQLVEKIPETLDYPCDSSKHTRNKPQNAKWGVYFINEFINIFGRKGLIYSSVWNKVPVDKVSKQSRKQTNNECSPNGIPDLADIEISNPRNKLGNRILHDANSSTKENDESTKCKRNQILLKFTSLLYYVIIARKINYKHKGLRGKTWIKLKRQK